MGLFALLALASSLALIAAQGEGDIIPLLFSEECCTKKTVGGVSYSQVAGDTTGFPNCEGQCVYEKEGDAGARYCFQSGGTDPKEAVCTESTHDSEYVDVKRNSNNEIHFKSKIGTHHCNLKDIPSEERSVTIECYKTETSFQSESVEEGSFFSSTSPSDELEWISLHSPSYFIHCDFINSSNVSCESVKHEGYPSIVDGTSVSPDALKSRSDERTDDPDDDDPECVPPPGPRDEYEYEFTQQPDAIFVLGAEPAKGNTLDEQRYNCSQRCYSCQWCQFWTLSHETIIDKERTHVNKSECGIRNYEANYVLNTSLPYQWTGNGIGGLGIQGITYTYKLSTQTSVNECDLICLNNANCTNWTWEMGTGNGMCSINTYIPTRLINLRYFNPGGPKVVSGCYAKECRSLQGAPCIAGPGKCQTSPGPGANFSPTTLVV